jgi:hypothetical protein
MDVVRSVVDSFFLLIYLLFQKYRAPIMKMFIDHALRSKDSNEVLQCLTGIKHIGKVDPELMKSKKAYIENLKNTNSHPDVQTWCEQLIDVIEGRR